MVRWQPVFGLAASLASIADAQQIRSRSHPYAQKPEARLRRRDGREDSTVNQPAADIIPGAYMIELEDGVSSEDLISDLGADRIEVKTREKLDYKLFHGVSLDVAGEDDAEVVANKILANKAVRKIWPVRRVSMPRGEVKAVINNTDTATADQQNRIADANVTFDYQPHVMTQVNLLHEAGFTGKGIRIAVLDTGVDYTHPVLGGCFGPGCLVSYGWNPIGGRLIADGEGPNDDPMDCDGHGTHVAGIIAARRNEYGFYGAAPDAEIGAYRVLDCRGGATTEHIMAGMLRAFEDGSDVLTMSLGIPGGWSDQLLSMTAQRIIEAGVPVFASIGNDGEGYGKFSVRSPSDGRGVGSVASYEPEDVPSIFARAGYEVDGGESVDFGWRPGGRLLGNGRDETFTLIDLNSFIGGNNSVVTGCSRLPASVPDLSGLLVLVKHVVSGRCSEWTQQENIVARGGGNMMFYGPGEEPPVIWGTDDPKVQGLGAVPASQAKTWREALAAGSNITVTIRDIHTAKSIVLLSKNPLRGGSVAPYSSWGPNFDLTPNPAYGAPGSSILSTYIDNWAEDSHSYAISSGTSMSAPLVAGAAALLMEARGTRDPSTIRALLASTAVQVEQGWPRDRGSPRPGLAPVMQSGSGMIQAWDAFQAKGVLDVSSISFNDSEHHIDEVAFTLRNTGDEEATYRLGHSPALTSYALQDDGWLDTRLPPVVVPGATADISFDADAVTVAPGASVEIKVRCSPPSNKVVDVSRWPIYNGFLILNGTNGDNLALPYLGNSGSMRTARILESLYTYLSIGGPDNGRRVPADTVFTAPRPVAGSPPADPIGLWDDKIPVATTTTILASKVLRFDLEPYSNCTKLVRRHEDWLGHKSVGQIWGSPMNHVTSMVEHGLGFWGFLADGTIVPEGRYRLVVSALRLFADVNSKAGEDWDSYATVPFVLKYEE